MPDCHGRRLVRLSPGRFFPSLLSTASCWLVHCTARLTQLILTRTPPWGSLSLPPRRTDGHTARRQARRSYRACRPAPYRPRWPCSVPTRFKAAGRRCGVHEPQLQSAFCPCPCPIRRRRVTRACMRLRRACPQSKEGSRPDDDLSPPSPTSEAANQYPQQQLVASCACAAVAPSFVTACCCCGRGANRARLTLTRFVHTEQANSQTACSLAGFSQSKPVSQ